MADSHSTPDTDQSGTERSVIVGYRPNVFDKSTPKIILSGKWLREAGFDTGQQISVKVMNGCIVLMVYGEQEQRLQDELQEANQKLKELRARWRLSSEVQLNLQAVLTGSLGAGWRLRLSGLLSWKMKPKCNGNPNK
ncbi:type I addiction module toxin, SymE family [Citrobacter freundii]|nr:SymE family type I addiction module toxin [Citrobacter freundii]RDT44488.1 type I addiction module toxin, SymE family [Citrobacter freundii]